MGAGPIAGLEKSRKAGTGLERAALFLPAHFKFSSPDSSQPTSIPGVTTQSTSTVLEGKARPEDIAHISDRDIITDLGELHTVGIERHDYQISGEFGRVTSSELRFGCPI